MDPMAELQNVITPITATELASALDAAWVALFGSSPSRNTLLVLLAQSAHETGKWASIHCFNIGNVKSVEGDGRDYTYFRCREKKPTGETVWLEPKHPGTRFRAYRTLAEAAIDHLSFLRGMKRYAAAWEALVEGKPREFVSALKAGGYFTDGEDIYARAVGRFFAEFNGALPILVPELEVDDALAKRAQGLVALSLHELGDQFVKRAAPAPSAPPAPVAALELEDEEPEPVSDTERPPPADEEPIG
jgi:hypothetical protein